MRVYHLNCATMCPLGIKSMTGKKHIVSHCLLIETNEGLALVDTGYGLKDIEQRGKRIGHILNTVLRPCFNPEESAVKQIEKLGFSPKDVRHIIPTHLDQDHAGGIGDFPNARVHIYKKEYKAIEKLSWKDKFRYKPCHWEHNPQWEIYEEEGESWYDFQAVRSLKGLPSEILLVPLVGHSKGHCGIAVQTEKGWLLHAGDSYFFHGELEAKRRCPLGIRIFEVLGQRNGIKRMANVQQLRKLVVEHSDTVKVFSAHDPHEFEQF